MLAPPLENPRSRSIDPHTQQRYRVYDAKDDERVKSL
jgi:hypothetical protein